MEQKRLDFVVDTCHGIIWFDYLRIILLTSATATTTVKAIETSSTTTTT